MSAYIASITLRESLCCGGLDYMWMCNEVDMDWPWPQGLSKNVAHLHTCIYMCVNMSVSTSQCVRMYKHIEVLMHMGMHVKVHVCKTTMCTYLHINNCLEANIII